MSVETEFPTAASRSLPARLSWLRRPNASLWLLLIITMFGGIIRFQRLNHPPLLIDECFTFWRTCGNYSQLISTLRDDGFVPLHYELLWWIHAGMPLSFGIKIFPSGIDLTPAVMRFFPAVCGTLMIPAIYFIARQLFNRRVSLLASLFVACSAYAQFFSRDSKMYMPAWFFAALGVGCFMWWLRSGRTTAWLAWIAAAATAGGIHVVTLLLLGLAPLYLLTQRKMNWRQCVLMIVGAILILAGPAGYYGVFNQWSQKSGGLAPGAVTEPPPDANWDASGLNWLGRNDSDFAAMFGTLSTYLSSYEWYGSFDPERTPAWIHRSITTGISLIVFFLVMGMLPWPRNWRGRWMCDDAAPEPPWRAFLWTIAWIILPAYGFFYCRSFDDPVSPKTWLLDFASLWGNAWWWVIPLTIIAAAIAMRRRIFAWVLGGILTAVACAIIILVLTNNGGVASQSWQISAVRNVLLIIIPAAIWVFAGDTIAGRLKKSAQFLLAVAIILALCTAANLAWAHVRTTALANHPGLIWHTIWHPRYVGIIWPAMWIAAAALIDRLPTAPVRSIAIAVVIALNLTNGLARSIAQTQVPYDRAMVDIWLSRPGSSTRTYFDLNGGPAGFLGLSGFPTGPYWRPIASYNAVLASRIPTSPEDFRDGKTWPFKYGPMMERFKKDLVYRPYVEPSDIAADAAASPNLQQIIVWQTTGDESPETDGLAQTLGPHWRLASEQIIRDWWYWTWVDRQLYRRREFLRR